VGIDPTVAEARLSLGLSLFSLGSRRQVGVDSVTMENVGDGILRESSNQLLFDPILHFNAAAALTSSVMMEKGVPTAKMEQIHVAALYNSALAYLALGDAASALLPLQKSANLVKTQHTDDEGILLPTVNLGAALIQRSAPRERVTVTNATAMTYCQDEIASSMYDSNGYLMKIIFVKNSVRRRVA